MSQAAHYRCRCGAEFPEALGAYGCPSCHGDNGRATFRGIPAALEQQLQAAAQEFNRRRERRDPRRHAEPEPRPLPHACCARAVPIPCVCAYAYSCPEHGDTHIGTHD